MRNGRRHALRTSLYGIALAALLMAIILPTVAARSNPPFRVRVLMAVADNSGVDVWIDDVQLTNNAQFKTLSAYIQREEGDYQLSVYPAGRKTQSAAFVYKRVIQFRSPKDYTIVVMGKQADNSIDASVEIDRNTLDGSTNAHVRLGDYIAGTGTLTLATAVSNNVLGNARSGETDVYATIVSGIYSLLLNDANGGLVTRMDNVTLGPNTSVSVFAVGLGSGTPGPSLIVNTDAGTPPVQAVPTPTATPIPAASPSAPAPVASPTSAASAALRQAFLPVPSVANTSTKVFYSQTATRWAASSRPIGRRTVAWSSSATRSPRNTRRSP